MFTFLGGVFQIFKYISKKYICINIYTKKIQSVHIISKDSLFFFHVDQTIVENMP